MNHELAKTLTTALVQFIDRERPEGTMCCSNTDCENIIGAFEEGEYEVVESFIRHKLTSLTEFQNAVRVMVTKALTTHIKDGNGREMSSTVFIDDDTAVLLSAGLLELAKNELLSYADESNPKIEAMADLERTYFCNPEKLPKWLKNDIARRELNAHTKGYNKGYKDAQESVAYHFPIMPTPPSGWGCDGTHCTNPHHDCINCPIKYSSGGTITTPNTVSGTSTATLHGNTSATDGKEHNPSFTD